MQTTIYSDINPINPQEKAIVKNIDSIFISLYNLFNTRPMELPHRLGYGCDIENALFMPINEDTASYIFQRIVEAIETWEERVLINYGQSTITPDYDNNAYNVRLIFSVELFEDNLFSFEGSLNTL